MNLKNRIPKHVFLIDKVVDDYKDIVVSSSSVLKKKSTLIEQQEKYIQKLSHLKRTLETESDYTKSKFWDSMMNGSQCFPKSRFISRDKSLEAQQEEPSRKTHLERLRKIRILQERRKATPILSPIHGTQILVSGKIEKPPIQQQTAKVVEPITQNWLEGNRIIKSVLHPSQNNGKPGLKNKGAEFINRYLPDNYLQSEVNFPNDIRELLRKTCHYDPPATSQPNHPSSSIKKPQTGLAYKTNSQEEFPGEAHNRVPPMNDDVKQGTKEDAIQTISSGKNYCRTAVGRVLPRSSSSRAPSDKMSVKNKFGVKSAPKLARSSKFLSNSKSGDLNKLEYISSQVVGYRLPPLQGPNAGSSPFVSESQPFLPPVESPRRQIIVKIPHDALKV